MSYTKEQRDKHQALIEKEMSGCTPQERGEVMGEFIQTWPDDKEAAAVIKQHKDKIALEATPEEISEAFKNLRI